LSSNHGSLPPEGYIHENLYKQSPSNRNDAHNLPRFVPSEPQEKESTKECQDIPEIQRAANDSHQKDRQTKQMTSNRY
ncbi:MAG: hypothetical protein ACOC3C_08310, partial [Candidatus Thorarchaeota archaeon]